MLPSLYACSIEERPSQISIIYDKEKEPVFIQWDVKEGVLPDLLMVANIYVANVTPHWGPVLALQNAQSVISMAPGFQKLLSSIDHVSCTNTVFVFMYGEEYVSMSMKEYPVAHDFYLPLHPELPISPQRQILPLNVVKRQVAFYLVNATANFKAIRVCLPGMRIVNVICPPPSVADPLKFKYYLLYVNMLKEVTSQLGIENLMPPRETVNQDGLLRSEYVADLVHGNTLYGVKVIEQINDFLGRGAQ